MHKTYKRRTGKADPKPALPVTKSEKKARNLPMFGPGIEISIPLHLLPEYMKLYGLEVLGPKQIGWLREHGIRKRDGVLYVRRVPQTKEGKHEETSPADV